MALCRAVGTASGRCVPVSAVQGTRTLSGVPRNPGMPLDLTWVANSRVNKPAVERRAAEIATRRAYVWVCVCVCVCGWVGGCGSSYASFLVWIFPCVCVSVYLCICVCWSGVSLPVSLALCFSFALSCLCVVYFIIHLCVSVYS